MTLKQEVAVTTDQNGAYNDQQTYNPPGWFHITVGVHAKLLSPDDTHVIGAYTVVAADGSTNNPPKPFDSTTGQDVDLGDITLAGGDNTITVAGHTDPAKPNTTLKFEIAASL